MITTDIAEHGRHGSSRSVGLRPDHPNPALSANLVETTFPAPGGGAASDPRPTSADRTDRGPRSPRHVGPGWAFTTVPEMPGRESRAQNGRFRPPLHIV
jgi:hypothetical protein